MTKTPEVTPRAGSAGRRDRGLYNASGTVQRLRASGLFAIAAPPGPALARGFLVAVPVAACLAVEFAFDEPTKGALATGAMFAGFVALDAPALPRAAWQAAATPAIGIFGALGILSSQTTPTAIATMAVVGLAAGYCFAYSLRLAIFGLVVALSLLIGQGFYLPASDALPGLAFGSGGAALSVLWSLMVWFFRDGRQNEPGLSGWDWSHLKHEFRANFTISSPNARHAIRFGACLAIGVAVYRLIDLNQHGYWVPLTVLFVMRPARGETDLRVELRAIGTVVGLIFATALAELVGGSPVAVVALLSIAAACAFGLLTVQYALFTTSITVYVVLLLDSLGQDAWQAAGERAVGTAIGLLICFLAFLVWPNRPRPKAGERQPTGPREEGPAATR